MRYTITEHFEKCRISIIDTETRRELVQYPYADTGERFHQLLNARRKCETMNRGKK